MLRFTLLLLFCFCGPFMYARTDTSRNARSYLALKLGLGFQGSMFFEAGISKIIHYRDKPFSSDSFYGNLEMGPGRRGRKNVYGIKCGYESNWSVGMLGLEVKVLSDLGISKFVAVPRAGLSLLGIWTISYGYQLGKKLSELPGIGVHTIYTSVQLNRKFFSGK